MALMCIIGKLLASITTDRTKLRTLRMCFILKPFLLLLQDSTIAENANILFVIYHIPLRNGIRF